MKKNIKTILIYLLISATILCASGTKAQAFSLNQLIAGDEDTTLRIRVFSPQCSKLAQFDDERTEQFNRLIRHFALDISLDGIISYTSIFIDDEQVINLLQKEEADLTRKVYSFSPNVEYLYSQDNDAETSSFPAFLDYVLYQNHLLNDLFSVYDGFSGLFSEYQKLAGTDLRLKGFGKAFKRVSFTFPAEFAQTKLTEELLSLAETETGKRFFSGLTFTGIQKTGLLYSQEGKLLRITYDGKAGASSEETDSISLSWKCLRNDQLVKDSLTLKRKPVSKNGYDNIQIERSFETSEDDKAVLQWELKRERRTDSGNKEQISFLTNLESGPDGFSGSIKYTEKDSDHEQTFVIIPHLNTSHSSGEFEGTLEITEYSGKIEKNKISVCLFVQQGQRIMWPTDQISETIYPDREEASAEPKEQFVRNLIQNVLKIPNDDLLFISNGISQDAWKEFANE